MGFNTVARFGDMTARTLAQIDQLNERTMTMTDTIILCWCALKEGARYVKKEFTTSAGEPVTVDDVGDWLDDDENALVEIMKEYGRSRNGNDPGRGDDKKKLKPRKPH